MFFRVAYVSYIQTIYIPTEMKFICIKSAFELFSF